MANQNYNAVLTYEVKLDGVTSDTFIRVSGIGKELEDIAAKDDAGKTTVNTPGSMNARDITLVRRFSGDKSLYTWFQEVQDKGNGAKLRTGSVRLLNHEQKQVAQFDIEGTWIKAWYGPELTKDVHGNSLLTETVVISVGEVKMV